ncbi:hypothetical protein ABK040_014360 [Willaertia magna]
MSTSSSSGSTTQQGQTTTALLDVLEQELRLPYTLFPPSLYSEISVTAKSKNKTVTIPMFVAEVNERFPKSDPHKGFKYRSGNQEIEDEDDLEDDEEMDQFFKKKEEYLLERIHQLINLVENHQLYANRIRTESNRLIMTITKEEVRNNLTTLVNKCLDTNIILQIILSSHINTYIDSMYPEGDGSQYVHTRNLSTNIIKTKLNSSGLTTGKMAQVMQMFQMMGGMRGGSLNLDQNTRRLKEEVGASTKPQFSPFTSPLSRYCKEIDNKRETIKNRYNNKEAARNIVEARCKKLTDNICSPVVEASISNNGDFYAAVCEEYREGQSLNIFFNISEPGEPTSNCFGFEDSGVNSVYCDGDNKIVWCSVTNGNVYGYKVKEENNKKSVTGKDAYCLKGVKNFTVDKIAKIQNNLIVSPDENLSTKGFSCWNINDLQNISNAPTIVKVPGILTVENGLSFLQVVPNSPNIMFSNESTIYHFNLAQQKYTNVFVGFGGYLTEARYENISTNDRTNLFVASSYDSRTYVFDDRLATPVYQLEGHCEPVMACELSNIDGTSFVFSGSVDESIRCWDLRMQLPLYELSTGNSVVQSLNYHKPSSTLIAGCNFRYNRFGYKHYSFHGDQEDEDELDWPKEAKHEKHDFKEVFDAEDSMILRYKFASS